MNMDMDKLSVVWLACVLVIIPGSTFAGKVVPRLRLQWKSFDCVPNPSIVVSHSCTISEPDSSLITTEVQYNRDFTQFHATFILSLPRPPQNKLRRIINLDLDFCEFFAGANKNKFVAIAYKSMVKNSNMPLKCPQRKGAYYFRNMSIADYLPDFLPATDFKVNFNFYVPQATVLNITLNGQLKESVRKAA